MQPSSNKLKWFWRINYGLTFYKVLVMICGTLAASGFGLKQHWFKVIDEIVTFDGALFMYSFFIECVQFPICLLVTLLYKEQRTDNLNYLYLALLIFLALVSLAFSFILMGSLGDM